MSLLRVDNLARQFPRRGDTPLPVIADVSLSLKEGEIVCLLGASGSGKTTLLHMLAGLDKPDRGTLHSPLSLPGPALGYMTQDDMLVPWRTVLDNVALGAELTGQSKKDARATAARFLEQAGLAAFAKAWPHQLSGGMKQRALLARTLATNPHLLLLDEPMSNLDILARREMAGIIKSYIRATNAAALVVTHSVEEACFLADRILLITRMPAVICQEINRDITLDSVMTALTRALEGKTA